LRTLFSQFGEVISTTIRHRIDQDKNENTSYALIAMGSEEACKLALDQGVTTEEHTELTITRFDQSTAEASKGGMAKLLADAEAVLQALEDSHDIEVFPGDLLKWPHDKSDLRYTPNPKLIKQDGGTDAIDSDTLNEMRYANPLTDDDDQVDTR
jgi:hypothetical protein